MTTSNGASASKKSGFNGRMRNGVSRLYPTHRKAPTNLIDVTEFISAFLGLRYMVNGISLLARQPFSYEDVGARFGAPYVAWRVGDKLIKIIIFSGETFNERNAILLQVLREIEHHKLVSEGENIVTLHDHTPYVNYFRRISENYSSNSSLSASVSASTNSFASSSDFATGSSLQDDNHEFQGALFMPMEYVQSGTLRDYITVDPLPGIVEKLEVMFGMLKGIVFVHGKNIIHCDLKLENMLVDCSSNAPVSKLCNFGSSLKLQRSDEVKFSPDQKVTNYYVSPETARNEFSKRSDIFTLGMIFQEVVADGRFSCKGREMNKNFFLDKKVNF